AVVFEYEPRPDPAFWYESGVRTRITRRLSRISMHAPDPVEQAEVWSYALTYSQSATTGRSLLSSVQRCEPAGGCLWAKQFAWAMPERPAFEVIHTGDAHLGSIYDVASSSVLDLDGDGMDDLLYTIGPPDDHYWAPVHLRRSTPGAPLGAALDMSSDP